jgi:GNAT superfamily N-acetyltransferase
MGSDQWQPDAIGNRTRDRVRKNVERNVAEGTCWLACMGDEVVGTITVDSYADPEFWNESDDPTNAVYVHRMIVRRSDSGRGIGRVLLSVAEHLARQAGRRWVRLDAWSTNERLHDYYRRMGFEHIRTLRYSHRGSGALFQREVPEVASPLEPSWTTNHASNLPGI